MTIQFDEQKQEQRLHGILEREEEDLAQTLSSRYGVAYADLTGTTIMTDALRLIPEDRARSAQVAAFNINNKTVSFAMKSPNRQEVQNEIADMERRGYFVKPFLVSTKSLEKAWSHYADISFAQVSKAGSLDISSEEIETFMTKVQNVDSARALVEEMMTMKKSFRISRIVEVIVAAAMATKASDIHVEPEEESVTLRFRIDGVLLTVSSFDHETYRLLLSRIKLLSGLKINIKDNAQDGRFSVKVGEHEIEIRSSVLPGNYGESIVMRLLDPNSLSIPIEDLGVPPHLIEIFMREINKPHGMILNTGPTGSGKTTTLYAFLNKKRGSDIKIITIEDPIEYHLAGVVQTQVNPKMEYDFAKGLKSSLRQDPDVIMVGEIRDYDTAETAVQAALTGHIVFSTLHTNNAAGAYPRLIDLGINSKILTSALTLVIAQRLARKLCVHCKKAVKMSPAILDIAKSIHESIPAEHKPIFTDTIYEPVGCEKCNKTGYRGRLGIYEAITTTPEIEAIVQDNPSEREIKKVAAAAGMMDMSQDGLIKILAGLTDWEEVARTVDMEKREGKMNPDEHHEI
jgi:type IV pilus assembly protein PilB